MMTMRMIKRVTIMMKLTAKTLVRIRWQTNVILKDLCRQLETSRVENS